MNARDQTPDDTDAVAAEVDLLTEQLAPWVRFQLRDCNRRPLAMAMALMQLAASVIFHDDGDAADIVSVAATAAGRVSKIHNGERGVPH